MSSDSKPQSPPTFNRYASSHVDAQGPGDSRPTAEQIIKDEHMEGQLNGKVILITGASSGIGLETARALAPTAATIVLAVRDLEKTQKVIEDLASGDQKVDTSRFETLQLDLDSLASVRKGAAEFLSRHNRLDILINNAGLGGVAKGTTSDGFETHFGVNHLAHFLLFELLKPTLLKSSSPDHHSRVISVSSSVHRMTPVLTDDYNWERTDYNPAKAYGSSKTANIWFANELERRYGSQGLHAISLHPGGVKSGLQRFHSPEFQTMVDATLKQLPGLLKNYKTIPQGAATQVLAAVGKDFEGKGGFWMEDLTVPGPFNPKVNPYGPGYMTWAHDEAGEKKLWQDSLAFVGLSE